MPTTEQAQTELEEEPIKDDDGALLALLRDLHEKKAQQSEEKARIKTAFGAPVDEAQEAVDVALRAKELHDDTTYRCGQFQITPEMVGGKDVAYTTERKKRFTINVAGEAAPPE